MDRLSEGECHFLPVIAEVVSRVLDERSFDVGLASVVDVEGGRRNAVGGQPVVAVSGG